MKNRRSAIARALPALCFALFFAPPGGASLFGLDARVVPLDLYLIVDGSAALQDGRDGAIAWIQDRVADNLLMEGDSLTFWVVRENAEILFSGPIRGNEDIMGIKNSLETLVFEGDTADYAAALREAAARDGTRSAGRIGYAIVVGGSSPGYPTFPSERETAEALRHSRVEDFPGWRVIFAALNIGEEVHRAALSFMN